MKIRNFSSKNLEETNLIERGFVFGACEDGTVYYKKNRNQYTIEYEQKILDWLEIVQKALQIVYNKSGKIRKTKAGYYRLYIYSKDIYLNILETRKDYRNILTKDKNFQIGFLQGIFDAEGTVHNKRYSIRIASKKLVIIELIRDLLEKFNIKTGKIYHDKTAIILPLYGKENLKKFNDVIGFRHKEKKAKLEKLISI